MRVQLSMPSATLQNGEAIGTERTQSSNVFTPSAEPASLSYRSSAQIVTPLPAQIAR